MKHLLILITSLFLFTACSSKKYFEPTNPDQTLKVVNTSLSSSILSMNREGATLNNGRILTADGISKFKLPESFHYLNISKDGKILASNYKDTILVGNDEIKVNNVVVAASLKDGKLALVYSNNSIELFDIEKKKTLFKDYLSVSLANDSRIANPHFMGNLVLFPTLNGKVIIISLRNYESIKNISVDAEGEFNNIIFLKVIESNQTLIAASPNKIVTISTKRILSKDYELRDIIINGSNVYIATIDGRIIKLDLELNEVTSKKYKYSKIHSLGFHDSLFAIESQGFLIKISDDFTKDKIYNFDFKNEERLIILGNKIYNSSEVITLP